MVTQETESSIIGRERTNMLNRIHPNSQNIKHVAIKYNVVIYGVHFYLSQSKRDILSSLSSAQHASSIEYHDLFVEVGPN